MILREAPMKDFIARRDELRTQAAAIDAEIARRAREAMKEQHEHGVWARLKPRPLLESTASR